MVRAWNANTPRGLYPLALDTFTRSNQDRGRKWFHRKLKDVL